MRETYSVVIEGEQWEVVEEDEDRCHFYFCEHDEHCIEEGVYRLRCGDAVRWVCETHLLKEEG